MTAVFERSRFNEAHNDFVPSVSSRWRESSRLTCEPDFCNLASHSAPLPCDCLRDEKAILERAAVWKKPPSCGVALVVRASRGSAEVKGIMITPQPRRSLDGLHIPPVTSVKRRRWWNWIAVQTDRNALLRRGSLLFGSAGSARQDGGPCFYFFLFSELHGFWFCIKCGLKLFSHLRLSHTGEQVTPTVHWGTETPDGNKLPEVWNDPTQSQNHQNKQVWFYRTRV